MKSVYPSLMPVSDFESALQFSLQILSPILGREKPTASPLLSIKIKFYSTSFRVLAWPLVGG